MNNKINFVFAASFIVILVSAVSGQDNKVENSESTGRVVPTNKPTEDASQQRQVISSAVEQLLEMQNEDGAWPYEGVYRVGGEIPVGYRIGGTAIVCTALISTGMDRSEKIEKAVSRATQMILKELDDPLMKPSRAGRYDVRIWGHIYALDYFCRLQAVDGLEELKSKTKPSLQKLADAIVFQEIKAGGWNYANQSRHCCFVTSPAVQSLLLAKQLGVEIPEEVFARSADVLEVSRKENSIFPYSGTDIRGDTAAGSAARGPVTEATLMLLGRGDEKKLQAAIDSFHQHWDELEKRRKQTGTHLPPHGIAPYYFYYAHRYAAQAIRMLPKECQPVEFEKLTAVVLRTKDSDNTWNDRVFDRSKAYGTAMSVLALSQDSVPLPPAIKLAKKEQ